MHRLYHTKVSIHHSHTPSRFTIGGAVNERDLPNSDMTTRLKGRKEQSFAAPATRLEHPPMRASHVASLSAVAASAAMLPEAVTSLPNLASFCAASSPRKKPSKGWIVSPSPIKKARKSKSANAPASSSFDALWAGNFTSLQDRNIEAHTLILGTHPSIKSLSESQYYGHTMNAFWWIAGDCLGFRRASGISSSTGNPYKFSSALRHGNIVPYETQLEIMCSNGFAMWDVIKSCKREGSLDQDIQEDVANDIEGFCRAHPSIRRIVLANGGTGCQFFKKHFKAWLDSGELVISSHSASQRAFKKWTRNTGKKENDVNRQITCIAALAVSPAAAKYTYEEKRAFWEEFVYAPGLPNLRVQQETD